MLNWIRTQTGELLNIGRVCAFYIDATPMTAAYQGRGEYIVNAILGTGDLLQVFKGDAFTCDEVLSYLSQLTKASDIVKDSRVDRYILGTITPSIGPK